MATEENKSLLRQRQWQWSLRLVTFTVWIWKLKDHLDGFLYPGIFTISLCYLFISFPSFFHCFDKLSLSFKINYFLFHIILSGWHCICFSSLKKCYIIILPSTHPSDLFQRTDQPISISFPLVHLWWQYNYYNSHHRWPTDLDLLGLCPGEQSAVIRPVLCVHDDLTRWFNSQCSTGRV